MTSLNEDSSKSNIDSFDIHKKLLTKESNWSYAHLIQPHQENSNFELITTLVDKIEFAIYKRDGDYMILVDFFSSYEEACEEARSILDSFPSAKSSVEAWQQSN